MSTAITPASTVTYKTTPHGLELKADIYAPAGDSTKSVPVILFFHIGGLLFGARGDGLFPEWLRKYSKEKGYLLVAPDYRLVPEATIDEILSDAKDAWTFVQTKLNAELKAANLPTANLANAFVFGESAGGYLALQGGHLFSPAPKAVVSLYGYGFADPAFFSTVQKPEATIGGMPFSVSLGKKDDIEAILGAKGPAIHGKDFDPTWGPRELLLPYLIATGRYFQEVFKLPGVSTDPKHAYLWPQTSFTSSYPPTFIGHGVADSIAPASESELFSKVLKEKGVEHELLLVPDVEHMFDHAESDAVTEAREKIFNFLGKRVTA